MKGVFIIKNYDIAIIGAGPIGLFSSYFAELHGLRAVLFESLTDTGGQPEMLYPFKKILDIPVFNEIKASELIKNLRNNLTDKTDIITNHKVENVEKEDNYFIIDHEFKVRSVIIATGNGAFKPKAFPIKASPAEKEHIHYFFKDPHIFENKNIGIFGGGDTALDWAQELGNIANVTLIHRRENFRGMESSVEKLRSNNQVVFKTPYLPKTMELINDQLNIGLKKVGTKDVKLENMTFDHILVAYGFRANNRFVKKWGVNLENGLISVNRAMQTNIDGIYAIGDAVGYEGRVPIIGIGFGEAQIAINKIMHELFPEKSLTIHSTSIN